MSRVDPANLESIPLGSIDIEALRKTHVYGWKPRMAVTLDVAVLAAILDELEILRALEPVREEESA